MNERLAPRSRPEQRGGLVGVSDPTESTVTGRMSDLDGDYTWKAVASPATGHAYYVTSGGKVGAVDCTDPTNSTYTTKLAGGGSPHDAACSSKYVYYLSTSVTLGIYAVDVTDPAAPERLWSFTDGGAVADPQGLALDGRGRLAFVDNGQPKPYLLR